MPYEIVFDNLPGGYSPPRGIKSGEEYTPVVAGFSSSEDGDDFIAKLEGWPTTILNMLPVPEKFSPSCVDHLFAIIRQDKTATVYVNELAFQMRARAKRKLEPNELISLDDFADVERINLENISVPDNAGVVLLFSCGWRKGFFYDFSPFVPNDSGNRHYDLEVLLGTCWSYLMFQHLFTIRDEEWKQMFSQGWFPFITLKAATIKNLISFIREGWSIDDLLEGISQEVIENALSMKAKWKISNTFSDHLDFLERGLERFLEKDYISAVTIFYTRIEGVMRTHYAKIDNSIKPTQNSLVDSIIQGKEPLPRNLLLPERFAAYLKEVYFASFDPNPSVTPPLSRNSVGHGVAPSSLCNLKGATISILILDQLSFYSIENDNEA
jgi:hypothetical protein